MKIPRPSRAIFRSHQPHASEAVKPEGRTAPFGHGSVMQLILKNAPRAATAGSGSAPHFHTDSSAWGLQISSPCPRSTPARQGGDSNPQSQAISLALSTTSTDSLNPRCYPRIGKASAHRALAPVFLAGQQALLGERTAHCVVRDLKVVVMLNSRRPVDGLTSSTYGDAGGGRPWRSISETPQPTVV